MLLLNRGSIQRLRWWWWRWRFQVRKMHLEILKSWVLRCVHGKSGILNEAFVVCRSFSGEKNTTFACLKCISLLLSCHLNSQACQECTLSYHQRQTRAAIANADRSMSYCSCDRMSKLPKCRSKWHSWGGNCNAAVNASHWIVKTPQETEPNVTCNCDFAAFSGKALWHCAAPQAFPCHPPTRKERKRAAEFVDGPSCKGHQGLIWCRCGEGSHPESCRCLMFQDWTTRRKCPGGRVLCNRMRSITSRVLRGLVQVAQCKRGV